MKLALLGVVIGIAAALALSRVMRTLLFEVTPFDPVSYAATRSCCSPSRRWRATYPRVERCASIRSLRCATRSAGL